MGPTSRTLTLPLAEGRVVLASEHRSVPNLREALANTASPALLFDWDSAVTMHANSAMERLLDRSRAELQQCTGRQLMPERCGVLADVVSDMLRDGAQYRGPITLQGSDEVLTLWVDMFVLDHDGTRFGLDVYRDLSEARSVDREGPPHILVVDDDPIVLRGMQRILSHWYAVSAAGSAAEALRVVSQDWTIDCVLTDVDMPSIDGLAVREVCELLRPDLRGRVVFHTATAPGSRVDADDRRAVFKPASIDDVRGAIERALASH